MVGSINLLKDEGEEVRKGEEHGYFAFGGSTVLLFFEEGRIEFEKDLLLGSKENREMLVRVNTRLGVAKKP